MYLCTVLALFISISGIIMVQSLEGTIIQIMFLPITIYFVISSIKQLFYKGHSSPNITLKSSKSFFITAVLVFFLLMFLGVRSIAESDKKTEENTTTIALDSADDAIIIKTSDDSQIEKIIVIKADNPKSVISIRKTPNELSPINYQAKVGEEFEYLTNEGEWYEIKISETETGWLKEEFIEVKK